MNLLNTLTYIKEVCNAHPLVNESFIGSIYDINSRTDVKYATMSVQADTIARQASGKTDYNVYLYYADRIPSNDDRDAILQVQTAAVNVMREILNYIKNYSDSIYIGSYTIHPFEQKFADETAGCWATVDIQTIDDIGDCSFDTSVIEEHFQNKVYLLENYYTKEEVDALLSSKQNTLIAGDNITIEGNVISATGGEDSVWEKDANNNIFPKGNTNVTGTNNFVTGLTSKADHTNSVVIGYNCESRTNNTVVIGSNAKDYDTGGDGLGWANLIAIGNNPVIPPRSLNTPYQTWQNPKFIVGGLYGFQRYNTLEQTVNGDLYIKGINGWTGTNATPDGTSHLQGYLRGLDTRISNNATAIEGKQNTLTAGENIDITNDVISVPQEVYLSSIFSPDDTYGSVLSFSARTHTSDYTSLSAAGSSADSIIDMMGAGNDNEAAAININAFGYSDASMQLRGGGETRRALVDITASGWTDSAIGLRGGTQSDQKATMTFTANGQSEVAEIQMRGGDDTHPSYVNIDSEIFTYKDNDVAVKPINSAFNSGDTIALNDNYIYNGTNIATLTINGTNFTGDCLIQFTTGSTDPVVTITGVIFEDTPVFAINKYYEINIHNGHALWAEFTA